MDSSCASPLALLNSQCAEALASIFPCSSNGKVAFYSMGGESDGCHAPDNPFLAKNDVISLEWEGCVQVGTSTPASRERKQEGVIEAQRRTITLPVPGLKIRTGWWAIISLYGDTLGGMVIQVTRDTPPLSEVVVDMSKPLPFSPELVGGPDWVRGVQI